MGSWAMLVLWAALAAPDPIEIEAALRRVLEADEYQTLIPTREPQVVSPTVPPPPPPPRRAEPRPPPVRPARENPPPPRRVVREDPDPPRRGGDDLSPIGRVLFWMLVGVSVVAIGVYVVRDLDARRRAKAALGEGTAKATKRAAAAAAAPIPEHERLALDGRHAEAIHAILLEVLSALGAARAGLRPAWTSREILSLVQLEEAAHKALASLVGLVEVTRFGGVPAREPEYRNAVLWLGAIGRATR